MKQFVKKMLFSALERAPHRWINGMVGDFCPVFVLHRVYAEESTSGHSVDQLGQCLNYIRKKKYHTLSLAELARIRRNGERIPERSVAFSADDGFIDQAERAGEVFSHYDIPLTYFVISDFLDEKLWPWDDQIKYIVEQTQRPVIETTYPNGSVLSVDIKNNNRGAIYDTIRNQLKMQSQATLYAWLQTFYAAAEVDCPACIPTEYLPMSWHSAQRLIDGGHEVAPHTLSHRILSRLNDEESCNEILGSIDRLNEKLDGVADLFAYPTGRVSDYSHREVATLEKTTVQAAVTTVPYAVDCNAARLEMPRYALPYNLLEFRQYLGCLELLRHRLSG